MRNFKQLFEISIASLKVTFPFCKLIPSLKVSKMRKTTKQAIITDKCSFKRYYCIQCIQFKLYIQEADKMLMMTMIDSSQCETWFHLLFGKKANPQQSPYLRNWGAIVVRILIFFMAMIMTAGLIMTMMVFT